MTVSRYKDVPLKLVYDEELGEGCYLEAQQAALVYDPQEGYILHLPKCSPSDQVPREVQYLTAMMVSANDTDFVDAIIESFLDATESVH